MAPPLHQSTISTFFGVAERPQKRRKGPTNNHSKSSSSSFGTCPICRKSVPSYRLEEHASNCNGPQPMKLTTNAREQNFMKPSSEPIPGLFLYDDFISEDEEANIISQLDGTDAEHLSEHLPWRASSFNGQHKGKRWGVHCDLRQRRVTIAENPLPSFLVDIVLPKLRSVIRPMQDSSPNEANAIDYHRAPGDYLKPHIDDRQLSKEPIANLSLAGDCYMTFRNKTRVVRVLLPRRCLQVLTGPARYDFSHGIAAEDILTERRVSVTIRESPITIMAKKRVITTVHS